MAMRKILFRGKREDNGEWIEGYLVRRPSAIQVGEHCSPWAIDRPPKNPDDSGEVRFVDGETVGQFTGLVDKNGRKIFEGDAVLFADEEGIYPEEICSFSGVIMAAAGAFGIASIHEIPLSLKNWCDNDNFVSLWELYWNYDAEENGLHMVEVIGNVHDNPELWEVTP